ncbi:hypothetical protein MACH24_21900 [Erythrobacter sp. Dej080120_24]|uniref:beta-propeller domain-containing protein n=1 Tax=unclassified Erythrobacter TaxID=2633097 RepID=UPI0029215E4E|nr:hypothetical protein MACH24_21900 [Erythrobacter sp. Dej080120_24]
MAAMRLVRVGAALVTATLLAGTTVAREKEQSPGEVTILLPDDIRTLPPEPFPKTDPSLANPEADETPAYQDSRYRRLATPEFETFENDVEFRRFLRSIEQLRQRERRRRFSEGEGAKIVVAALQDVEPAETPPECAVPEDCPDDSANQTVVVTGSRIASNPQSMPMAVTAVSSDSATGTSDSITNVQVASVDEGDIVKLIGQYLLVLQDGRVFAVHHPTMTLTDRTDVYRKDEDGDPIGADWYDEMLVQGDQIIVTAYSYEDDASEITVLRLDQETGKVSVRGVFLISSDDYYDVDNYATRIAGDRLVIYTPYEAADLVSRRNRPVIRRWTGAEDFYDNEGTGKDVLEVRDIYRPVFGVKEPWVHTVSVCPLGEVIERGLSCETTGFVGADPAEMYVTPDAVYLWTSAVSWDELDWNECQIGTPSAGFGEVPPAAVFRMPIGRGEVEVLGARGMPIDQFGMDATGTRFRALSSFYRHACSDDDIAKEFALMNASQGKFRDRYIAARESEFARLPSLLANSAENRFVGDWIVYGGRDRYSRRPPRDGKAERSAQSNVIHAVPVDAPEQAETISIGHSLVRLERMGEAAVIANGYADESGLRVSYIGLAPGASAIRSSAHLPGRYESESRSHAFNATYTLAGDGMLGVPTVSRKEESGGWWWYSDVSDLSFLGFDAAGLLADGGLIRATPEDEVETGEGYDCEVSCIDWYGNARPIFLGGKVYGLMATELVEAEVVEGRVAERRRVDLTGPLQR